MEDCSPFPPPPATPVTFMPDVTIPIRTRYSAFELPAPRVTQLRLAYQRLRDLTTNSPNDPRGWLRQANVHCWYCNGLQNNGVNAGPEVHGTWRFLPWHRMFLYVHERILGQLVNDSTLTLPFWDWDTPGRDQLPPIYADQFVAGQPNPLFDQNRGAVAGNQIPPGIVDQDGMQMALLPTSFELPGGFGGTPDTDQAPSSGTLENSPHGPVHIWTGDPTMQTISPDMGVLAYAARDPIFFAHHSNIDRIWDVWLNQGGGRMNPQESAWGMETFNFYDQNSPAQWVSMAISDTVDHGGSLRYVYQGTPNPAAQAGPANQVLAMRSLDVTPQSKEKITLPVPAEMAVNAAPLGKRVWVLNIHGIEIPADQQAFLRVFVEKPDADVKTPVSSPNFVGQFVMFARTKPGQMPPMANAPKHAHVHNKAFTLTDQQVAMLKSKNQLDVKLINLGGPLARISFKRAFLSSRVQ